MKLSSSVAALLFATATSSLKLDPSITLSEPPFLSAAPSETNTNTNTNTNSFSLTSSQTQSSPTQSQTSLPTASTGSSSFSSSISSSLSKSLSTSASTSSSSTSSSSSLTTTTIASTTLASLTPNPPMVTIVVTATPSAPGSSAAGMNMASIKQTLWAMGAAGLMVWGMWV